MNKQTPYLRAVNCQVRSEMYAIINDSAQSEVTQSV